MATIPLKLANYVFGAKVIGALLNSASWGMSCIQAYTYFTTMDGKSDIAIVQYTVAFLVVMNTAHVVLASYFVYWYVIVRYGDPMSAVLVIRTESASDSVTEVMIGIIRLLFARRIWKLSNGNRWLTTLVCIVSLGSLGIGVASSILIGSVPSAQLIYTGDGIYATIRGVIIAVSVVHINAELMVTFPICYYLYTMKGGFRRTDSVINILIKYAIGTGAVIIVFSVGGIVINTHAQQTDFGNMLYIPLASLYMNCYLAGMNLREKLGKDSNNLTETSIHFSNTRITPCAGPDTMRGATFGANSKVETV